MPVNDVDERDLFNSLLPNELYVSGMSFDLQGWNGKYIREKDGFASYFMKPYILYGWIHIIGTRIYFKNGKWRFQRFGDTTPLFYSNSLEGSWDGFVVSRQESHFKKMLFSGGLLVAGLIWLILSNGVHPRISSQRK
jgi:hypothetical protein